MKKTIVLNLVICILLSCGAAAEVRTYRQFKDVAAKESGKISQSDRKGDLFEYTYDIDAANKIIIRTKMRRLDEETSRDDRTIYNITQEKRILGSDAGFGGDAIVAVSSDGSETLVLSHRFAFTSRISPFSQLITGVYKRVYDNSSGEQHERNPHKHKKP